MGYIFRKEKKTDKVYWADNTKSKGLFLFSFDKKKVYNLFQDYPDKLTPEEKEIFEKENPFWVEFFSE